MSPLQVLTRLFSGYPSSSVPTYQGVSIRMKNVPKALEQPSGSGLKDTFLPGDGEIRPRPGKLTVALVGHSILDDVRRLAIQDPDLSESLDLAQIQVLWLTTRGLNWQKLRRFSVPELQAVLPDVVYVQVVGNDITDNVPVRILIDRHLQQARACIEGLGAKSIIIGSAIHRQRVRGDMTPADFNARVDQFNKGMRKILCRGNVSKHGPLDTRRFRYPQIWFWQHKRLLSPKLRDGVHLERKAAKRLYYSIRLSIKNVEKALSSGQ